MATGLIAWNNFSHADSYQLDTGEISNSAATRYIYVSAPSIYVEPSCHGAFLATSSFDCKCYYRDWNTNTWVLANTMAKSVTGANSVYDYFYHNYSGSNTLSDDSVKYHFWKIVFDYSAPGTFRSARIKVFCGGVGRMSNQQYIDLCKDKYIVSCGRLGQDNIYDAGNTESDSTALSYFSWFNDSGTQISGSMESKLQPKNW